LDIPDNRRLSCFKAYDVRGRVPDELDEELAYRIGRAYAAVVKPGSVVVGRDVRNTGRSICEALTHGLTDSGSDVLDIGLCGTEQVYFSTWQLEAGGGIMVTASHNPADYNGMKFVREGAIPVSGDSGLRDIEALASSGEFDRSGRKGTVELIDTSHAYVEHLLSYIDTEYIPPYKVLMNPGNGSAGPVLKFIGRYLPIDIVRLNFEPDGDFPNGVPNPLLPQNRSATTEAIITSGAELGLAWDGDFDRCFFFDENGEFVEGYYIVGLLAGAMLSHFPGSKIIHDPRLVWNTIEVVKSHGGIPVMSKTGHAFIKERMRAEDALYGGEMSAHHYFRDFAYCDSGMIPWLILLELIGRTCTNLSELVSDMALRYPVSGEINREVEDPAAAMAAVETRYAQAALSVDRTDGLSMEFEDWRFNLRMSNTEPLVRLNVESRGDAELVKEKTEEILGML